MTQEPQANDRASRLTWAVLLARWIEFAQSSLALSEDGQGKRLRQSVPDIIMLQAVWFALDDLDGLCEQEHSLGMDRAELLIEKHSQALRRHWQGHELPPQLVELVNDSYQRLKKVANPKLPPTP